MSALVDIIELILGLIVIPRVVLVIWILIAPILGANLVYLTLAVPIVLMVIVMYFMFKVRKMVAYGLILAIISQVIEIFLAGILSNYI